MITFALRYNILPSEAHVLPALFEGAARKVGMTAAVLLAATSDNPALGQYLADCARKVARECPR